MHKIDRQRAMLAYLDENPALTVEDAMVRYQASPATVRRDFAQLIAKGMVMRGPNEIRQINVDAGTDKPLALREITFRNEKNAIAERAAELLKHENVVFIDGGTTTQSMVRYLPHLGLRIITTCIRIAEGILERSRNNPDLEVSMPGGILSPQSYVLYGPHTAKHLEYYRANWAFIGVDSLDEANLYSVNDLIASSQTVMIENSDRIVLLADHSKFGHRSMVRTARLDRRFIIVTNQYPENNDIINRIRQTGAEVLIAKP